MTDEEVIRRIRAGAAKRKEAIRYLYELDGLMDRVRAYVRANSGDEEDVYDVFHDGIILFDRNVRSGNYRKESSIEAYLYSICKYHWMNEVRKKRKYTNPEHTGMGERGIAEASDASMYREDLNEQLDRLLEQVSAQCRKIFSMWKLNYSMEEIAKALDLSSPRLARKYKYRCMKRLVHYLEAHPAFRKSVETLLYG